MKSGVRFLILLCAMYFTVAIHAATPGEELQQLVQQLQQNPGDTALRERIIKLAQAMRPAPAIPEEAERRMARGAAAIKGAKSVADYQSAATEFEQATLAAPWYGDAYFNLGVAQDKAEKYEAALRSLRLALLAAPNDKEIKALIYEVEYRLEKSASPEILQAKKADAIRNKLNGAIFVDTRCPPNGYGDGLTGCSHVEFEGDDFGFWAALKPTNIRPPYDWVPSNNIELCPFKVIGDRIYAVRTGKCGGSRVGKDAWLELRKDAQELYVGPGQEASGLVEQTFRRIR